MRYLLALVVVVAAACTATPAAAQYDIGPPVDYHVMNQWTTDAYLRSEFDGESEEEPEAPDATVRFASPEAFAFTPDRAARTAAIEEAAAQLEAVVPGSAGALRDSDPFGLMRQALAPLDLSVNNLADASAVFVSELYDTANATETPPSREIAQALREQMAAGMSAHTGLSEGEMQSLSDRLYLQTLVVNALRTACSGAAGEMEGCRDVREEAAAAARTILGFDVTRATIGPDGLLPAAE